MSLANFAKGSNLIFYLVYGIVSGNYIITANTIPETLRNDMIGTYKTAVIISSGFKLLWLTTKHEFARQ
jgi:hypothetical protein